MANRENLAARGQQKIEWIRRKMPVLQSISREWEAKKPLLGFTIGACLHISAKTANLARTLQDGGAQVVLCASNPLSTQEDVAAALNEIYGIKTFARRGEDRDSFYRNIHAVLEHRPQITIDDGADLVSTLHSQRPELLKNVLGGTEETTTGVIRLKAMAEDNALKYPIIAVNDAQTKHLFDNRYGTGQSALDGILRATNYLLAGSNFVVVGYGWCGRGIAARARGMGAKVTVVEVDPVRALEATMDGFMVCSLKEAAAKADFIVTATGNINVVDAKHLELLKDGAILCNAGHFNVEINLKALAEKSSSITTVKENIEEYKLHSGKKVFVIGEGRLVNLAAGEGHPAEVMDMSFANQALAVAWLIQEGKDLENRVYPVPEKLDKKIARLKLKSMGIQIDKMTAEQVKYLHSWQTGT
ncbi:MAG: adenosylhomocysteinase [Firmicutes bacterium]|nr:adenosylhomocysteinase [Bacillota bacterium]